MNRPRKQNRDLPACVYLKHGSYFYVKRGRWINLGKDKKAALNEYAKISTAPTGGVPGLLHRWLNDIEVAHATKKNYTHAVKILSKAFAEFEPHQVTARDIMALMYHYKKMPGSANLYRTAMIGALEMAFMEQIVERNVARDVKPLRQVARDRYLSDAEFNAIKAKATPTLRVIMELCYLTGQRISDVIAIRYADLTDEGIGFKQQKTKHRMLVSWSTELIKTVADAKLLHKNLRGLTLLHTRKGTPFTYSTIRTLWDRACKAAKVDDAHIHDMRAKSATDAEQQGLDSKKLLGHRSESSHNRYLRSKETSVAEPVSFRQK